MYKSVISLTLLLLVSFTTFAIADTAQPEPAAVVAMPAPATGWGPSVVGSVGAFYFNGNYQLLAAGINVGTAYTWDRANNVNSIGVYVGPQSSQTAGVTSTTLNAMMYANLYQTSVVGFGVGIVTRIWQSGMGMDKAVKIATTGLVLGCKF